MRKFLAVAALTSLIFGSLCFFSVPGHGVLSRPVHAQQYAECITTGASPLNCNSSSYGLVTIAASAQTATIQTSAVTANAVIILTYDYSTGTPLGVTCNTTGQPLEVSARVVGSSFTIKALTGVFSTNPGCINLRIINQ